MVSWLKKVIGITVLEQEIKKLNERLDWHEAFVNLTMEQNKKFHRVDADIGFRGNNTIILTGVYRQQAYVKFYDLGEGEFGHLVEQLGNMRKHSLIRHIDAPLNFSGKFHL